MVETFAAVSSEGSDGAARLLPASTIAYYLMKVDLARSWSGKSRTFLPENLQSTSKLWAIDFKQEVLPELGPECGAVMLELPEFKESFDDGTWATFCKLKSNKLAEALSTGKLFNGVGPAKDFAEVKSRRRVLFLSRHAKGFWLFPIMKKGWRRLTARAIWRRRATIREL